MISDNKQYYRNVLDDLAEKSTCDRANVSAILISQDGRIFSTGYNGAERNAPHCDDVGHLMEEGHCVRTVHAEVNAIINASHIGIPVKGEIMISRYEPCHRCMRVIINSGIEKCFYYKSYQDDYNQDVAENPNSDFIDINKL